MSTASVALVPLGASGYTGSSFQWRAQEEARAFEAQRAAAEAAAVARHNNEVKRLRLRQRIFTWMYNALAVGELVYFIVGLYYVDWQVADLQDNPLLGPGSEGVIKMGGTHAQRIIQRNQYWRLVTSLFYNAGAIHLAANLGMVWAFGHFLVRRFSPISVALIYFGGGLAGMLVSVNIGAEFMTAGASIPAFALAGAATIMLLYCWRNFSCHLYSVVFVCFIVGVNVFIGATPFVDNSGNTAGFVFGGVVCMGVMLLRREANSKGGETLVYGGAVFAAVVILATIVGGLAGLQMDTPIADCCHEWVCTSSSWWDCETSRIWPTTCKFTSFPNSNTTSILTCPKGNKISVDVDLDEGTDSNALEELCRAMCGMGPPSDSPSGGATPPNGEMSIRRLLQRLGLTQPLSSTRDQNRYSGSFKTP